MRSFVPFTNAIGRARCRHSGMGPATRRDSLNCKYVVGKLLRGLKHTGVKAPQLFWGDLKAVPHLRRPVSRLACRRSGLALLRDVLCRSLELQAEVPARWA